MRHSVARLVTQRGGTAGPLFGSLGQRVYARGLQPLPWSPGSPHTDMKTLTINSVWWHLSRPAAPRPPPSPKQQPRGRWVKRRSQECCRWVQTLREAWRLISCHRRSHRPLGRREGRKPHFLQRPAGRWWLASCCQGWTSCVGS